MTVTFAATTSRAERTLACSPSGSATRASNQGKKVGNGWNAKQVFSGDDGVIYALMDNGDLLWNRHDGRGDGSFTWASNQGKKVGNGWNAKQVFSG
jgi:Tachylectin